MFVDFVRQAAMRPIRRLSCGIRSGEHEILQFLKLASCLNLPVAGSDLEFSLFPNEAQRASEMPKKAGIKTRVRITHPGVLMSAIDGR